MSHDNAKMQAEALFASGQLYKDIGEIIYDRRTALDWTQVHLAKLARLNVSVIRSIEAGRPVSLETLSALLRVFEIDPRDILPQGAPEGTWFAHLDLAASATQLKKTMKQCSDYNLAIQKLRDIIGNISKTFNLPEIPARLPIDHYSHSVAFTSGERQDLLEIFGRRIQIFRTLQGATASQIAHKSHVSLTSLSLIEAGLRNPSLETVYRIAEGLSVSVYYLIPGIHDDADLLRSLDMTAWAMSAQSQLEALADLESIIGHLDDIANH